MPKNETNTITNQPSFWKDFIQELFPDASDLDQAEIVTLYLLITKQLQDEWKAISGITGEKKYDFSLKCGLNREQTPSGVSVTISYSEKHGCKISLDAEDPEQQSLDFDHPTPALEDEDATQENLEEDLEEE